MICKFLLQARTAKLGIQAYDWLILRCFIIICSHYALCYDWSILSMQRPFIRPSAYGMLIVLFTTATLVVTIATVILLFLLLFHHCCHHITVTTDKLCQASFFSGVVELRTQLLRLINILCLSLCRINKLGLYYPWRLLRSPTLVGHQPITWSFYLLERLH